MQETHRAQELRRLLSEVAAVWLPRGPATADIRRRIAEALKPQEDESE